MTTTTSTRELIYRVIQDFVKVPNIELLGANFGSKKWLNEACSPVLLPEKMFSRGKTNKYHCKTSSLHTESKRRVEIYMFGKLKTNSAVN